MGIFWWVVRLYRNFLDIRHFLFNSPEYNSIILQKYNTEGYVMSLCVDSFSKAICEPERQTGHLSISYRHGIVGEAVLIHYHIIERYLARDPPDNVAGSIWANGVVSIPEAAPQK